MASVPFLLRAPSLWTPSPGFAGCSPDKRDPSPGFAGYSPDFARESPWR
jgi:hypothetical protein